MPRPDLATLGALERRLLWLSAWMIHHANHLRPTEDGEVKVGGHQASSASLVTIMTALYFHALRPEDRVAVKPHAGPVFHAIQYLAGAQSLEKLQNFRAFGGAQSYPSRTKDSDDVDFSTGSVGLGVAQTLFASLVQDYVIAHGWMQGRSPGRMVSLLGDAEMDEGNIYEALLEGWKQDVRNLWWVVDYNRQSLDAMVRDGLWARFEDMFRGFGWDVVVLRHGTLQQAAFAEPGGAALQGWIEQCPNPLYAALSFRGARRGGRGWGPIWGLTAPSRRFWNDFESRSAAPSSIMPVMKLATPLLPSGSAALPVPKEKLMAISGTDLSSTSQALSPPGLVTSWMAKAWAEVGTHSSSCPLRK